MGGIRIKANVLGEILSSNGLLRKIYLRKTTFLVVGRKATEFVVLLFLLVSSY